VIHTRRQHKENNVYLHVYFRSTGKYKRIYIFACVLNCERIHFWLIARVAGHYWMPHMETFYWKGDLAQYTGKSMTLHGGLFYEFVLLDGHLKGEIKVTMRAPS